MTFTILRSGTYFTCFNESLGHWSLWRRRLPEDQEIWEAGIVALVRPNPYYGQSGKVEVSFNPMIVSKDASPVQS